jgi:hypothetical protein
LRFLHAIDPASVYAPEGGIPEEVLIRMAEQEAKRLVAAFRERAAATPTALDFVISWRLASQQLRSSKRQGTGPPISS